MTGTMAKSARHPKCDSVRGVLEREYTDSRILQAHLCCYNPLKVSGLKGLKGGVHVAGIPEVEIDGRLQRIR